MTNSLGVAEDFGPERGQPPGFHVGPIRACERFYLWESRKLSILRPGLVNQSQEY